MILESCLPWTSLLACGSVAAALLYWAFQLAWLRTKYDLHKIPTPKALSIFGHAQSPPSGSKPRNTARCHRWALELGKVYKLNIMGKAFVVVNDPEFVQKHAYGSGENDLPKPDFITKNFNKLLTPYRVSPILTMSRSHAKYKSFRKTLACAFSTEALKKAYPNLLSKVKQCASKIESLTAGVDSIDIQDLAVPLTFDSIGLFAYGVNFDAVRKGSHPLLDAMNGIAEELDRENWKPFFKLYKKIAPFSAAARNSKQMFDRLYSEYEKVFAALDVYGDPPPTESDHSLRAQLMRLRNPFKDDQRATKEEMLAEMASFLIAGTDTTSHQLTWILMCLSTHLDVQDRVYNELKEHGLAGANGVDPDFSILARLPYLNCVLKEGMRLISTVPNGSLRVAQADLDVLGYRVPRGTFVIAFWSTLNTCPWLWENGDSFDPDRWASEVRGPKGQKEPETAMPESTQKLWTFGVGARSCVGQRLAVMELQLMLIVMLSKFRFTLDPRMGGFQGALDRGYDAIAFSCEGGMWLRASPRV